jgi:hypothetical protein
MVGLAASKERDSTGGEAPPDRLHQSAACKASQIRFAKGMLPPEQDGGEIMFQVRIHGRGGQGVVTAAEMLSIAAFEEGRHAQAFPSFGSERTGAPVVAFCRIADKEIRLREPIMAPTR